MAINNTGNMRPEEKAAANQWQQMLALAQRRQQDLSMLGAAQNASPDTMVGFALGKLLGNAFGKYMDNYYERGKQKRDNQNVSDNPMPFDKSTVMAAWNSYPSDTKQDTINVPTPDSLSGVKAPFGMSNLVFSTGEYYGNKRYWNK